MVRTIECKNALPTTRTVTTGNPSSSSGRTSSSMTVRHVDLPSADAFRQKLLKSCSPTRNAAPSRMASTSTSTPPRCHTSGATSTGGASSVLRW